MDDDNDVLEVFQLLLKRKYDVTTMSDAEGLMSEGGSDSYDIAIFDHRMRHVTSTDLIPLLKKRPEWQSTHFVIHSGTADLEQIAINSHADGYLPKPSSIDDILAYMAAVFEKKY